MTHPALIERITRSLAYMLRHQPEQFDLELDEHGFANLEDVVRALNERLGEPVDEQDVVDAVHSGDRVRYEIKGDSIRALYGHSIEVKPGEPSKPPPMLYVGVSSADGERAQRYGLRAGRRSFLHLALTPEDALETGRRAARDYVVITVNALDAWEEGINFYDRKSLFLSDPIPTHFLQVGEVQTDGYAEVEARGSSGGDGRREHGRHEGRPRRGPGRAGGRPDDGGGRGEPERRFREEGFDRIPGPAPREAGEPSEPAERGHGERAGARDRGPTGRPLEFDRAGEPSRAPGRGEPRAHGEGAHGPRRGGEAQGRGPRRDEPRRDEPRRDEPRREGPRRDEFRRDEPRQESGRPMPAGDERRGGGGRGPRDHRGHGDRGPRPSERPREDHGARRGGEDREMRAGRGAPRGPGLQSGAQSAPHSGLQPRSDHAAEHRGPASSPRRESESSRAPAPAARGAASDAFGLGIFEAAPVDKRPSPREVEARQEPEERPREPRPTPEPRAPTPPPARERGPSARDRGSSAREAGSSTREPDGPARERDAPAREREASAPPRDDSGFGTGV